MLQQHFDSCTSEEKHSLSKNILSLGCSKRLYEAQGRIQFPCLHTFIESSSGCSWLHSCHLRLQELVGHIKYYCSVNNRSHDEDCTCTSNGKLG